MTYTSICMGQDNKKEQLSYAASLSYKQNKKACLESRTFYHCSIFTGRRFASFNKKKYFASAIFKEQMTS